MSPNPLRVKSVFLAASDLSSLTARSAFLDRECGTDIDLRLRVEALLRVNDDAPPLDTQWTGTHLAKDSKDIPNYDYQLASEVEGVVLAGKYKLQEAIGEGGMGSVWMAEQLEPVKRKVAIKLIKEGMDSKRVLARFDAERHALALMDHPHIAKVLDAGSTDRGSPFFVMELVKGIPLTQYCDHHKLSIRDRLELFQLICSAVQHAHQKGIIHRDLKPSNILIESHDGKPVPKIIDFGLAKAINEVSLTDQSAFTGFGMVMGTPLYMAPEQATFNAIDVDTRADIYALGVILYESLTSTTPIERDRFIESPMDEILRAIREEDPPTPSNRLSSTDLIPGDFDRRQIEPKKLRKLLKGDLDWIVMKALAKERNERYQTAMDLANDLSRYLRDEPVLAGPPSTSYRLKKFIKRNKGRVAVVSVLLLFLVLGIAGTTWGYIRAESAFEAEQNQRKKVENTLRRAQDHLETMTSAITGNSLSSQKAITPEQKQFLEEVLTYYWELAEEDGNDERSRARIAHAASRLGLIEARLGRKEQAIASFRTAQKGFAQLVADFPLTVAYRWSLGGVHNDLAILHNDLGKVIEAEKHYIQAMRIQRQLVAEEPCIIEYQKNLAMTCHNLGLLFIGSGRIREAEEAYRVSLNIREKIANEFPFGHPDNRPEFQQDLASSQINLGLLYSKLGKGPEAEKLYRQGIALQQQLADKLPNDHTFRTNLGISLNNFGVLLNEFKKEQEATEQFQKAFALQEKLVAEFPSIPQFRLYLASSYNNLGSILQDQNKFPEATEHYRKAHRIREQLTQEFPKIPEYRSHWAASYNNLAVAFAKMGNREEAQEHHQKAIDIRQKLIAEFPNVPDYQFDLARSFFNFGDFVREGGNARESLSWYQRAITILEPIFKVEPKYRAAQQLLLNIHRARAKAYNDLEKYSEAIVDWERCIELTSRDKLPNFRAERISSLLKANRTKEAIEEVSQIITASNWNAMQSYYFASFYSVASAKIPEKRVEYANRAMELLQKAVGLGFVDASHLATEPYFDSLRDRDDFRRLINSLSGVRFKERLPLPHPIVP
jgi:serine/threonine protein kinase/Tfp pilus assembly protein PilF